MASIDAVLTMPACKSASRATVDELPPLMIASSPVDAVTTACKSASIDAVELNAFAITASISVCDR